MIFADPNVFKAYPPPLSDDTRVIDDLAKNTGADIIVSDKAFPPIGDLVAKHASGNSVFIVLTEFPDAETENKLRMLIEINARVKQFVILSGVVDSGGDRAWYRDGYKGSYRVYIETVAHILSCGAQVVTISDNYLDVYVRAIEKNINNNAQFIPTEIKNYKPICDGSITLASVPVIRTTLAKQIYERERAQGRQPVLIDLIAKYTNKSKVGDDLCSQAICEGARKWFGIPDGWNITLEPDKLAQEVYVDREE